MQADSIDTTTEVNMSNLDVSQLKWMMFEESWSLKLDNRVRNESSIKRRRRGNGGRRRRRHMEVARSQASSDVGLSSTRMSLRALRSHPCLHLLDRLTICNVDDILPVDILCLLLGGATNLKELVLENITLFGEIGQYGLFSAKNLERVSLSACGPAEDTFVEWLLSYTKDSLVELSLCEMLISTTTFDSISQLSSLQKLHLKSVPALYHSNLLQGSCKTSVSELYISDTIETQWFMEQNWNLGSNLQRLSLVFDTSLQSTRTELGEFVASSIIQRFESMRSLSLEFHSAHESLSFRGSWIHFLDALQLQNSNLHFLQVYFDDQDEWLSKSALDSYLENLLANDNKVLSKLVLKSRMHTVRFSPRVQFFLDLNRAGRQGWISQDGIDPEDLAIANRVFPDCDAHQLSMIFYVLSNHASWIRFRC